MNLMKLIDLYLVILFILFYNYFWEHLLYTRTLGTLAKLDSGNTLYFPHKELLRSSGEFIVEEYRDQSTTRDLYSFVLAWYATQYYIRLLLIINLK